MILTVAIPSYNRAEAARDCVVNLSRVVRNSNTPIILANNGSERGTYNRVESELLKCKLGTFIEFSDNKEFALNLIRLLSRVETRYVLVLSDEDDLSTESLNPLTDFLEKKEPALVILRPGRKKSTAITIKKLRGASSYISGIVFNMDLIREILSSMEMLVAREEFAYLYPQVLMAAYSKAKGKTYRLSNPHVRKRVELRSTVKGKNGNDYWLPTERVLQHQSLMNCLNVIENWVEVNEKKRIVKFRNTNRANFFGVIFDSVKTISPELLVDLTQSSYKTSLRFGLKRIVRVILVKTKLT